MSETKKGDWVRFWRDGSTVIGEVQYVVESKTSPYGWELITTAGIVFIDDVLERREAINE